MDIGTNYILKQLDYTFIKENWQELAKIDKPYVSAGMFECWREEHFVMDLIDKWELSFYIYNENEILGYRMVSGKGKINGFSHSHRTSVLQAFQRRGIGKHLLDASIGMSKIKKYRGITGLRQVNNNASLKFLTKMKWTNTGLFINKNELWKFEF